jgi:hypothetical protein
MSAAPSLCENPCETCTKEGLPLLLTRYALLPNEAGAPKLSGKLDSAALKKVPLGESAHYGLRLLRSGYVYVYDEKRNHWSEYFVTADGYLAVIPPRIRALQVQRKPATEFQCARKGVAPLAGVITIRNAMHAEKIWITFSDVEWTDAVYTAHLDADHRKKHMKCLVVSKGKITPQDDTAPLEQLERLVPEFKLPDQSATEKFSQWCPHRYNARSRQGSALLAAAKRMRPKGGAAIVALHDPVGLVTELAALMEARKTTFMKSEDRAVPLFAASTIASVERGVREQAKLAEIEAGEQLALRLESGLGHAAHAVTGPVFVTKADRTLAASLRANTPASLKKVADAKWRKYTHDRNGKPRFNAEAAGSWLDGHNEDFAEFDKRSIAPMAQAQAAWMQTPCMVSHLSCNYDPKDKPSGVAFTANVVEMFRYTTDKQPSYDLYLKWLKSGEFTDENLVMRALAFNQKDLIEKLKQADAAPVDGRAFPSDAVVGMVSAFMGEMPKVAEAKLTALLAGLSGPVLKYWDEFNAGKVGSKAAASIAAVCGKQFVRVPVTGTRGQFIQAYMRELYRLDPNLKANPNQMQAAISKQLKLLEIEGVPMNSKRNFGWYVLLDREQFAGATSKNLTGQALANEVVKAGRTAKDIQELDAARTANFRSKVFVGATVLGGLLMVLNYSKLLSDVDKAMSHEQEEAKTKMLLGGVALAGFVAEQVGTGLEKLGEARLANMAGKIGTMTPRLLQIGGRFAGFGVGVVLGFWDIWKGQEASKQGDHGLAKVYKVSGISAAIVSSLVLGIGMGWIAAFPIAWIALIIATIIWLTATAILELAKDNPVQEWLARCYFGSGSDKYKDLEMHIQQYKAALSK